MYFQLRRATMFAFAVTTSACAMRARPTTYFVPVNAWEQLSDCILVTSIERGYTTRMSTLGIHVTRPPKGKPTRFNDINNSQDPRGPDPRRLMKPGIEGKPVVVEEVFYERIITPDGLLLKAESRAIDRTANAVVGSASGPTSRVAPSAHIQGAQRELEKACMRDVQLYMGKPTGQVTVIAAPTLHIARRTAEQ